MLTTAKATQRKRRHRPQARAMSLLLVLAFLSLVEGTDWDMNKYNSNYYWKCGVSNSYQYVYYGSQWSKTYCSSFSLTTTQLSMPVVADVTYTSWSSDITKYFYTQLDDSTTTAWVNMCCRGQA